MAFEPVSKIEMAIIATKINNLKRLHGEAMKAQISSYHYDLNALSKALDDAFTIYIRIIDRNIEFSKNT